MQKYISLFLLGLMLLCVAVGYSYYFGVKTTGIAGIFLLMSFGILINHPVQSECNQFDRKIPYTITGIVEEIQQNEYGRWIILKSVSVSDTNQTRPLRSCVQLQIKSGLSEPITYYDQVIVVANYTDEAVQMNPSDMDVQSYLKGKNVGASFKVKEIIEVKPRETLFEQFQKALKKRIAVLYTKKRVGIIEALLLGDDEAIQTQTKTLYNQAGIGHVLCISGFHVGVVMAVMLWVLQSFLVTYHVRYLLMTAGIWFYVYLTGASTSTVRAGLMATILLIGKCLWQEEDRWNSLALACLSILMVFPYQLFQAGFQLSFGAVLGIIVCMNEIDKKERASEWRYLKWQKSLLVWLFIQFAIWPVLAYHFYEIPFVISLINLIIIPIFSIVIIGSWGSILIHLVSVPMAKVIASIIECLLNSIEISVDYLMRWPLATLCIGRPTIWQMILFGLAVGLIGAFLFEYIKRTMFCKSLFILGCSYQIIQYVSPNLLSVTLLYVGQGDSTVIQTTGGQVIVIDGGNFGKGKVLERYIKYRGKREVEAMMISHSDSDHIGGLIELLDSNVSIRNVFISATDESKLLQTFLMKCDLKGIPVYPLEKQDRLTLDEVSITCLAPVDEMSYEEANNNSLVCLLSYGNFTALFTGDKEKSSDVSIYNDLEPITLLKVSHHGSRTGTSNELLLKLQPMYAMISCGKNNLYGHPHQEVTALLEAAEIKVNRTDVNGAICYETNGKYIKEIKHRKDT